MKGIRVVLLGLAATMLLVATACVRGPTIAGENLPSAGGEAMSVNYGQQTGLSVEGVGEVSVAPDVVQISVGVEIRSDKLSGAISEATKKMDAVVAALKSKGVAEKDIKTTRYNVSPLVNYKEGQPVSTNYVVTNMVNAKVRQVPKVGEVLDACINAGANRIESIIFTVDDPKPLQAQARDLAMADAKAKAEKLASLAGVKLGKPLQISETGTGVPLPWEFAAKGGLGMGGAEGPTPISPGETVIRLNIHITYAMN